MKGVNFNSCGLARIMCGGSADYHRDAEIMVARRNLIMNLNLNVIVNVNKLSRFMNQIDSTNEIH